VVRAHMDKNWSVQEAMTRPLTDGERELLASWNQHALIKENDRLYGSASQETAPKEIDGGNTGDTDRFTADTGFDASGAIVQQGHSALTPGQANRANELGTGRSDLDADLDAQREEEDRLASSLAPDDEVGDDDTDEFSKMNNKQLRGELRTRELHVSGTRSEMLARLRTADAES
jgi:hypothetical protein